MSSIKGWCSYAIYPIYRRTKVLANSVDLEQFLRMRGEKLERVGREHKLIYYDGSGRHDSITLRGSTWFDHKIKWAAEQ